MVIVKVFVNQQLILKNIFLLLSKKQHHNYFRDSWMKENNIITLQFHTKLHSPTFASIQRNLFKIKTFPVWLLFP